MDICIRYIIGLLERLEKWDTERLVRESGELFYFIRKQVFSQIPGVSAIGAILVGAWVSSTFTTSPIKGRLASWGLIKGGTHVVSSAKYRFLSVMLPVLAAALTAYLVQKALKAYRERQLRRNMALVAGFGPEVQKEVREKLAILEKAREAGLISAGEYGVKKANLYQSFSRTPSRIEELIIKKLAG